MTVYHGDAPIGVVRRGRFGGWLALDVYGRLVAEAESKWEAECILRWGGLP